ncbi:DciA family protein [Streptomyces sp. NPDC127112]|uniref:DciA family protein n=1 Tax=Streptomyces sp. NPDC127112 TaxID=3345364 RepID=UPI003636C72C
MSRSGQTPGMDLARQALDAARAMAREQGTATTAKQRCRTRGATSARDPREPTGLRWVLLRLQCEYGWETAARAGEVLTRWASLVGPAVAAHLEAVAYDRDRRLLEIRPDSSAWSIQAELIKAGLLVKLGDALGPDSVRTITVLGVDGRPHSPLPEAPASPATHAPAGPPQTPVRSRKDAPPGFHRALQAHLQTWGPHKTPAARAMDRRRGTPDNPTTPETTR